MHFEVCRIGIGLALLGLGRADEAMVPLKAALARAEALFGTEHDELRSLLSNLALAAREAGRSDEAEAYLVRALRIQSALGRDDIDAASLMHSYGFLLLDRGELDAAAAQFERAGTLIEELIGNETPDMGWVELGRGRVSLARGNPELALVSLAHADALWSSDTIPPDDRADLHSYLATALWETGDRPRALALARQAAAALPHNLQLRAWLVEHGG